MFPLLLFAGCTSPTCQEGYPDGDADGFGVSLGATVRLCEGVGALRAGDCNDQDPNVNPDAIDVCNGLDDNCDGEVDPDRTGMYVDADGDGYGTGEVVTYVCESFLPFGLAPISGDCEDSDPLVHPAKFDNCDGVDTNCDGVIDNTSPIGPLSHLTWRDGDGDGHGGSAEWQVVCGEEAGWVSTFTDCDDTDPARYPGSAVDPCVAPPLGTQTTIGAVLDRIEGLPSDASSMVAGDLDGDGLTDLVLGADDGGSGRLVVHLGGPTGPRDWWTDAAVSWDAQGLAPWVAAVGDINGDGKSDLAVEATFGVAVLENAAVTIDPAAAERMVGTDEALWFGASPAGDVDGDGGADLWLFGLEQVSLYHATGTATDDALARVEFDSIYLSSTTGDLDGDGLWELIVADSVVSFEGEAGAGTVWVFAAPFTGEVTTDAARTTLHGHVRGTAAGRAVDATGDLDGDGTGDLVLSANDWVAVLDTLPPGEALAAEVARVLLVSTGWVDHAKFSGDVDGDGFPDIAVSAIEANEALSSRPTVALVRGPVAGTVDLGPFATWGGPINGASVGLGAGDTTGDGVPELILLSENTVYFAGAP